MGRLAQAGAGRLALHIITGGDETDQHRDGDFLDHDSRYRRTAEYLHIVRHLLTSSEPLNFEGEFYVQDTWRVTPNLTLTGGLRYSLLQPPFERTGEQAQPTISNISF